MEIIQSLIQLIQQQITAALWNVFAFSFLFSLFGLIAGILLVRLGKRQRWFYRRYTLWRVFAGLNYVYIPVLLMILGGIQGGIYGSHRSAGSFIDKTTEPIVQYGKQCLPAVQEAINNFLNENEELSPEEIKAHLHSALHKDQSNQQDWIMEKAVGQLNQALVIFTLEQILPEAAAEPIVVLARQDITHLDPGIFDLFPNTLHMVCDAFFETYYLFIWNVFLPFLLLPLAEAGLYWSVSRILA